MSRWIDADAVISEMEEKHRPNFHEDLKAYHMWIMWYWALKNAPTIDIDRPQDDEFKNFDRESLILLIEVQKERIGELLMRLNDFCSYGCREERSGE